MEIPIYISILIPFISALFGGFVTFYFASKSKRQESILKFKEEKYSNLLILLQGFVGDTANSETKRKFFDEQYKSWIYSSDEVVTAVNNLVELAKQSNPNPEEGRKAIGSIVSAMRKDLLKKTSLTYKDFVYTNVN